MRPRISIRSYARLPVGQFVSPSVCIALSFPADFSKKWIDVIAQKRFRSEPVSVLQSVCWSVDWSISGLVGRHLVNRSVGLSLCQPISFPADFGKKWVRLIRKYFSMKTLQIPGYVIPSDVPSVVLSVSLSIRQSVCPSFYNAPIFPGQVKSENRGCGIKTL